MDIAQLKDNIAWIHVNNKYIAEIIIISAENIFE